MAKLSTVNREKKRELLVNKYFEKRQALKKIISDVNASEEDRWKLQHHWSSTWQFT